MTVLYPILIFLPFLSNTFELSSQLGLHISGIQLSPFCHHLRGGAGETGLKYLGSEWTVGTGTPEGRAWFLVFLLCTGTSCPTCAKSLLGASDSPGTMRMIKWFSHRLFIFLIPTLWS